MNSTFSLASGPKIGDIDPTTGRPVLVRHIRRSYLMAAQHLLGSFKPVERSENSVAWEFTAKLPRAITRMICWEMLLVELGHNPVDLRPLYRESVKVTQHDWFALAGVLELFKATAPRSKRTIETRGEADECVTEWVQKTTWEFAPSAEIVSRKGQSFADAVRSAVQQGRIKLERKTPMAGLRHCVRDESETTHAFHTALRQICDSSPTSAAYNFMHAFQEADWKRFMPMLHTAIRMNSDKTTVDDFVEGVSKRLCDMHPMEFAEHGYLWKAFCCVLSSFSKSDWEGVCSEFVAYKIGDATDLPASFAIANESA